MKAPKHLLILLTACLCGCKNSLLVERNEKSLQNKPNALKIACIDPRFYFEDEARNYQLKKVQGLNQTLKADIVAYARKNKIQVDVFDLNEGSSASYYYDLLRLKQNMLAVNLNQRSPLNNNASGQNNSIQKKVFVYPPKISYEFNSLSKAYGTPYFSYLGIYELKKGLVLYHIVVNTDMAETVYREYKYIDAGLSEAKVAQMIYDSYALLNKELLKK